MMRQRDGWDEPGGPWHGHGRGGYGQGRGGPRRGGPWGGRRVQRGDIPALLLTALLDGPAHGYELIRKLEDRSGGMWRPSAGSVYPTLQMLEEQGLVASHDDNGKRVYTLSDEGRVQAEANRAEAPWEADAAGGQRPLYDGFRQLGLAVRQVAEAGDGAQIDAAIAVVGQARQQLYRLLAGD